MSRLHNSKITGKAPTFTMNLESTKQEPATIEDARQRLDELHAEAIRKQMSCRIVVEVTYQRGVLQNVQDERRRYGK